MVHDYCFGEKQAAAVQRDALKSLNDQRSLIRKLKPHADTKEYESKSLRLLASIAAGGDQAGNANRDLESALGEPNWAPVHEAEVPHLPDPSCAEQASLLIRVVV